MASRINVDQQQQHVIKQQAQSTIPPALPPTSIPVEIVWPSLSKGDASTKNASSLSTGINTKNSATKAPMVSGAWAARVSKS
jgi:hypothetical protein